MNKFSNKLTDCRSRLLDAEATLNFLRKPEYLNTLLEADSPDVTVGAMVNHAWQLVAAASGDCEAMTDMREADSHAGIQKLAVEGQGRGVVERDPAIAHFDNLDAMHSQTGSLLSMLMLYLEQLGPEGEELHPHVVSNYVWQLQNNIERAQKESQALYDLRK